jgi:hypothetical protein
MQIHQSNFQIQASSFGTTLPELRSKLNEILISWANSDHQDGKVRQASLSSADGWIYRKPIYFELDGIQTVSRVDQVLAWENDSNLYVSVTSESVERLPVHRYVDLTSDQLLHNAPTVLSELFSQFTCRMGLDLLNRPFEIVKNQDDVAKLISALSSSSRLVPMVLLCLEEDNVADTLESSLWNILGSSAYIRVIPEIWLNEINDELGISHSVQRKGMRVFAPQVLFDESRDGYRHPFVNFDLESLDQVSVTKVGQLRDRLSRSNWQKTNRELLSDLRLDGLRALRLQDLQQNKAQSQAALETHGDRANALELRIKSLEAELEEFVNFASELEVQASQSKFEADFNLLQFEEQSKELAAARESGAYFRRILEENKLFGEIYGHEPNQFWAEVPSSFEELVFAIQTVPYVEYTGSLDPVKALDAQPSNMSGIYRCWESLRALSDYARLKSEGKFSGSFYQYLQSDQHSGYQVSAGYFAHNESESVQNDPNLRLKRLFPVPVEHLSDGSAFMFAHAKLITGSSNSPRMHYLDDTAGSHKIYVGYIGAHLPTPGTN